MKISDSLCQSFHLVQNLNQIANRWSGPRGGNADDLAVPDRRAAARQKPRQPGFDEPRAQGGLTGQIFALPHRHRSRNPKDERRNSFASLLHHSRLGGRASLGYNSGK